MALTLGRRSVDNGFRRAIHHMCLNSVKGQRCYNTTVSKEERNSGNSGNVKVITEFPFLVSRGQYKLTQLEFVLQNSFCRHCQRFSWNFLFFNDHLRCSSCNAIPTLLSTTRSFQKIPSLQVVVSSSTRTWKLFTSWNLN